TPHARRGPIAPAQNHGLLGSHPDQPALPAPPDRTHWAVPAFWPVRPYPALPDSATNHDRRQPSGNPTPAAVGSVLAQFALESHPGPSSALHPTGSSHRCHSASGTSIGHWHSHSATAPAPKTSATGRVRAARPHR